MSARRGWAWPLVPLYAAGLALKNWQHRVGLQRAKKLGWPVISVGSLSAGGAGKTPTVIALAKLFSGRGWTVDVLTRGYRREGTATQRVRRDRRNAAREFGDEPVLIARAADVPVWVGADRFAAGTMAEAEGAGRKITDPSTSLWNGQEKGEGGRKAVHLLDDGFQHRRLARTVDVVLVTAHDLQDVLLPVGNLREPVQALLRAQAVVVREEEAGALMPRLRGLIGENVPVWNIRRKLRFPAPLRVLSAGLRPIAFCAIARPEGFEAMLASAGCGVVETVAFPDHHHYTQTDVDRLIERAKELSATGFVTTEKDAVKLTRDLYAQLTNAGLLAVVALDADFVEEAAMLAWLEARLQ